MTLLEQGIGFGLIQASIIAIASVGFTMQFGIANLLNLAFTEVMSVAGFVVYVILNHHVNLWVSLLIGAGVGAAVTLVMSKVVYDPFRKRGAKPFTLVIISLALNLLMQNALLAIVGRSNFTYPVTLGQENIHILHARFSGDELIIIGIAVGLMVLLHVFLQFTQMGRAMRALASNRELARSSGIPTGRIESIVWAMSGGLAGIAGVVLFPERQHFHARNRELISRRNHCGRRSGWRGRRVWRDASRGDRRRGHRHQQLMDSFVQHRDRVCAFDTRAANTT